MSYGSCHANAASAQTFPHLCSKSPSVLFFPHPIKLAILSVAVTNELRPGVGHTWARFSCCSNFVQCDANESKIMFALQDSVKVHLNHFDEISLQHGDERLHEI